MQVPNSNSEYRKSEYTISMTQKASMKHRSKSVTYKVCLSKDAVLEDKSLRSAVLEACRPI